MADYLIRTVSKCRKQCDYPDLSRMFLGRLVTLLVCSYGGLVGNVTAEQETVNGINRICSSHPRCGWLPKGMNYRNEVHLNTNRNIRCGITRHLKDDRGIIQTWIKK